MALQVICPAGCRLQVPRKCAGTMVRCPKCGEIIKIAEMSAVKDIGKGMQSLTADLATEKEIADYRQRSAEYRKRTARKSQQNTTGQQKTASQDNQVEHPDRKIPAERSATKMRSRHDSNEASSNDAQQEKQRWRLPGQKSNFEEKEKARKKQNEKQQVAKKESTAEKSPGVKKKKRKRRSASEKPLKPSAEANVRSQDQQVRPTPEIRGNEIVAASLADEQPAVGVTHNKQTRSRSLFLAAALVFTGLFLILPAISPFLDYVNSEAQTPIPYWAGWLVFVGLLQFAYATYAYQLADWTSIWAVAITMLVLTVITAFLLSGLALSPPGGFVSRIFQIPISMTTKAEIWLLILLLITSLIGYLSGREAFRWKQAEDRWREKYAATK